MYIITNADSVRLYKNDEFIREYTNDDSEFKNLAHGPVRVTDYIGDALTVHEGMPEKQAQAVKDLLNGVAEKGLYRLSPMFMAKAGIISARYRMTYDEAVALYGKYIANWGGIVSSYRFEAVKNGEIVKTVVISASTDAKIETVANTETLHEGKTYDVALVRMRAVDQNGNLLNFYNDPVRLETKGSIKLIGPDTVALSGGMGGVYVRSAGEGRGTLRITDSRGAIVTVDFTVCAEE